MIALARGWPNALIANQAMMLIWAMLVEDRELKGLSAVPLIEANTEHEALDPAGNPSAIKLYRMVTAGITLTEDMQQRRTRGIAATAIGLRVASTNFAIKSILGLDPVVLEQAINARAGECIDADIRGRAGLNILIRRAPKQFAEMHAS